MTGNDNNTPYDCTIAGEKQGKAMAIRRRDAIPFEICNLQKKVYNIKYV